jgi:hypothetical protein
MIGVRKIDPADALKPGALADRIVGDPDDVNLALILTSNIRQASLFWEKELFSNSWFRPTQDFPDCVLFEPALA